jgi:glucokinase
MVAVLGGLRGDRGSASVVGVGVAAPGPLDIESGVVLAAPNLTGWRDVPLAAALAEATGLPVWVNNDANLAALGEARTGAGIGFDPLVYLTVSTGVGGGIVQGGRITTGAHGLAGELGHVVVEPGGPACNFGHRGCLEGVASGTATAALARARLEGGAPSRLLDPAFGAGSPTAAQVAEAARAGDALAAEVLGRAGSALGRAIAGYLNVLDPARVVIGGGVSRSWDLLESAVLAEVRDLTMAWDHRRVDIVVAALGDDAGLVGGASYAFDRALVA